MNKYLKIFLVTLVLITCLSFFAYAVEETLTITTYYPSPYGSYNNLTVADSLGIGTTSPQVSLDIYKNTTWAGVFATGYGATASAGGIFMGRAARGTIVSPTATQVNDRLAAVGGRGYGTTNFSGSASGAVVIYASEAFSDAAQGAYITLETTPVGSTASSRAERVRVGASGNVGIGTTNPGQKLEVSGRIRMDTWTADGATLVYKSASGDIGVISSDVRTKKNIKKIENPLDIISGINGVKFNWLTDPDNAPKTLGVIAQDVQKVLPEAVFTFKNEQGEERMSVHYDKLSAVIIEAVKAQQKEIDKIKAELAGLKASKK